MKVFVSSKEGELHDERLVAIECIKQFGFNPISSESRPASDKSIHLQYSEEVSECDIYLGIFYLDFSPPTVKEFGVARAQTIPTLVFQKLPPDDETKPRDRDLDAFLKDIMNPMSGIVIKKFQDILEFRDGVGEALIALLVSRFKEFKKLSVDSQTSYALKEEIKKESSSPETEDLMSKIMKIEELRNGYGLVTSPALGRGNIIDFKIPPTIQKGWLAEVWVKITGSAKHAFLNLLLTDPYNKQLWFPDPGSWDSALDKGKLELKTEYDNEWTFGIPSKSKVGDYKALVILYEDTLDLPTNNRRIIDYKEYQIKVTE